ncbi:hypothetical protein HDU96_001359 [Phlyctochytrium bullatum]|nr:hypothetical protein HDU96_001359 [Phlyctochytrium bullatum]
MISSVTLVVLAAIAHSAVAQTSNPLDSIPLNETAFGLLPTPCQRLFARNNATYASHVEAVACFNQFPVPRFVDDIKRLAAFGFDFSAGLPWYEAQAKVAPGSTAARVANFTTTTSNFTQAQTGLYEALNPGWNISVGLSGTSLRFFADVRPPYYVNWMQPLALVAEPTDIDGKRGKVVVAGFAYDLNFRQGNVLTRGRGLEDVQGNKLRAFFAERAPSVNLAALVGSVVESINGKDPWTYADEQNAEYGATYIPNMYGQVVFTDNAFDISSGTFPNCRLGYTRCTSDVSYSFRNPQTGAVTNASFPWAVFPRTFDSLLLQEFMSAFGIEGDAFLPSGPNVRRRQAVNDEHAVSGLERRQLASPATSAALSSLPQIVNAAVPASSSSLQNVVAVNSNTLAVILTSPYNSVSFDFFNVNRTTNISPAGLRIRYQNYTGHYRRMDEAIANFASTNPGIQNLILDLTQWTLEQDYFAFLQYFFGTASPIENSFRLTGPMERLLRAYSTANPETLTVGLSYEYLSTSRHLNPTTLAPTDILASRTTVTPPGASDPVTMSGRFVFADQLAAHSLLTRTGILPPERRAFFNKTKITLVVRYDTCTSTCPQFVRIARKQFGARVVTYGSNAATQLPAFAQPGATFEDTASIEALAASVNNTQLTPLELARRRSAGATNTDIVAQHDAGAAADAVPIGVTDVLGDADLTLKLGGTDWPLRVWNNAVDSAAPALVAAGSPSRPQATGAPTSTATLTATTVPAPATTKSAGVRVSESWMAGIVALVALVAGWMA